MNAEHRTIEDVFSDMRDEIQKRKRLSLKPSEQECLCGQGEEPDLATDDDDVHGKEERYGGWPVYLAEHPKTKNISFAVCPACNPKLQCALCQGTGHRILPRVQVFETEHGKIIEQVFKDIDPYSCGCLYTEKLVSLLNDADIPTKYKAAEINGFKTDHLFEEQERKLLDNIHFVEDFCSRFSLQTKCKEQKKHFLTLFGPVGSGKTELACAALKTLMIQTGWSGKFVDFQDLLHKIKLEYEHNRSGEGIMHALQTVDILVIDEFGKGRNENEWQLEKLDELVNARYNAKRITIITTNYLPFNHKYPEDQIPRRPSAQKNFWENEGNVPVNETFWTQSLQERIGTRMYERILEVSEFTNFLGIPSYRKSVLGREFLTMLEET